MLEEAAAAKLEAAAAKKVEREWLLSMGLAADDDDVHPHYTLTAPSLHPHYTLTTPSLHPHYTLISSRRAFNLNTISHRKTPHGWIIQVIVNHSCSSFRCQPVFKLIPFSTSV